MKTSFYFFLWFIVYILIGLTGNQFLMEHDFFVALVFVFAVSRLDKKLFAKELKYQANMNRFHIFEIFYSDNVEAMAKILKRKCLGQTIWAIYCILTVVGLLMLHSGDIIAYVIFGFFGLASMGASSKFYNQYKKVKNEGLTAFELSDYTADEDAYNQYRELRLKYTAKELEPKAPSTSKRVSIVTIIFATLCVLIGGFNLFALLFNGEISVMISAVTIWSVLAIYFGVRDIFNSANILQGKPVPSL